MSGILYLPDKAKPRHLQLKRLILARNDMKRAESALIAALALKEDDQTRPHLISAAVVYYARSFSSGRTWSRIAKKWEQFEERKMVLLHRFVCDWRNSAVAHSDAELHDVEFIPRGSKLELRSEDGKGGVFTLSKHGEYYAAPKFPTNTEQDLTELCRYQCKRMKEAIEREKDLLFDEFIRPRPMANKAPDQTTRSVSDAASRGSS